MIIIILYFIVIVYMLLLVTFVICVSLHTSLGKKTYIIIIILSIQKTLKTVVEGLFLRQNDCVKKKDSISKSKHLLQIID